MTTATRTSALYEEMSLVFLAVDQLNVNFAHRQWKGQASSTHEVVRRTFDRLATDVSNWLPVSEIRSLFLRCGICPVVNLSVLARLLECIAHTERVEFRAGPQDPRGAWTLPSERHYPPPPGEEVLFQDLHIYRIDDQLSFSSGGRLFAGLGEEVEDVAKHLPVRLYDEFLDPIAALRMYLTRVHDVREVEVGHYLQNWIVTTFRIPHTQEFRFTLAKVCDAVNEIFHGVSHPAHRSLAARGATLGTSLLVQTIARLLDGVGKESLSYALGVFLFLRKRRLLRFRYQLLEVPLSDPSAPAGSSSDSARERVVGRAAHRRQCVSMLRPLEYTFLQTAIFGIQIGIQGLNFVLRGGLLPRVATGRTFVISGPPGSGKTLFALQLLCDIAAKGGLGVYCSLEEDYDSILERLVTFDLIRPSFRVLLGKDEPLELLRSERATAEEHPCGTLLLYQLPHGEPARISEIVEELTRDTAYNVRALVLDSLNALTFEENIQQDRIRTSLYSIVREVEDHRFFGFFLSEADDPRLGVVAYLADTVLELTPSERGQMRRLEVRKSRTQDYHRGPHPFHLAERKGIVVFPSLGSVRDTIRRRVTATLSQHRHIPLPAELGNSLGVPYLQEKSSVLIAGAPVSTVLQFSLQLFTEPSNDERRPLLNRLGTSGRVRNALIVTFNTSEVRFNQILRRNRALHSRWVKMSFQGQPQLRWYSPGGSLTADQVLAELRQYILRGRRYGHPIERVLFYEVEMIDRLLPTLAAEKLFWPTIIQFLNTEAITSMFVVNELDAHMSSASQTLEAEADYSFRITERRPSDPHAGGDESPVESAAVITDSTKAPAVYVETRRIPKLSGFRTGGVALAERDADLIR
ncbi:RAD55 family ATPase [Longimicrobium sp.]|jgi:KaiC/GvpD/RAD55 family RecA-like ATPase|uniref:RAD55 family ATPase n=1 Tax=Longimicrobium sp. TaxID=2029185 RepID=UPI002ED90830